MATVYLVEGWHYAVPGNPLSVHASESGANERAAELVRAMGSDGALPNVTAKNWRKRLAAWRRATGYESNDSGVEITPLELQP